MNMISLHVSECISGDSNLRDLSHELSQLYSENDHKISLNVSECYSCDSYLFIELIFI